MEETSMFADWVLGVVAVLFVGGVAASIKSAIDVAVIKEMLRTGQGRMDTLEQSFAAMKKRQKRHSERLSDLERK